MVLFRAQSIKAKAPPERGTFFTLHVYARVRISLVEANETVRKYVISFCKKAKSRDTSSCYVVYSYLKDSAFTSVKGMQVLT